MIVAYDFWANYHFAMVLHSAQLMLLASFCWALPDTKFEYWLKQRLWVFYTLALINIALTLLVSATGIYFYYTGPALYSFLGAAGLIYILFTSGPILILVVVSFTLI